MTVSNHSGFKTYITHIHLEELTFPFFIGDPYGERWYANRTSSTHHELAFIRDRIIRKGDVVFDVGAQHGFHTIAYANWIGRSGKIVAFEAHPRNARILKKNIKVNHVDNVMIINRAMGAAIGKTFITDTTNAHISTNSRQNELQIKMVTLDQYFHFKPNLLKIDVEGYELEVLKGAKNILNSLPALVIELHPPNLLKQYATSAEEVLNFIAVDKYDLWIQRERNQAPVKFQASEENFNKLVHLFAIPK